MAVLEALVTEILCRKFKFFTTWILFSFKRKTACFYYQWGAQMLQKQEACLSWRSLTWAWGCTRVAEASSLPCTEKTRAGEIVFQPIPD